MSKKWKFPHHIPTLHSALFIFSNLKEHWYNDFETFIYAFYTVMCLTEYYSRHQPGCFPWVFPALSLISHLLLLPHVRDGSGEHGNGRIILSRAAKAQSNSVGQRCLLAQSDPPVLLVVHACMHRNPSRLSHFRMHGPYLTQFCFTLFNGCIVFDIPIQ